MTAAVALAPLSSTRITSREIDGTLLASVGLNRDTYEILRAVSQNPSVTINVLHSKIPHVKSLPAKIQTLTKRGWLHRYVTVYNLTVVGWIYLSVAKDLLFPR